MSQVCGVACVVGEAVFTIRGMSSTLPATRNPSSALLPFFGGRVPLLKQTTERKATLILSSLLEDLSDIKLYMLAWGNMQR